LQVDADVSVLRQSKDVWRGSRFHGDGYWLSVPIFVGDLGHLMLFLLLSWSGFSGELLWSDVIWTLWTLMWSSLPFWWTLKSEQPVCQISIEHKARMDNTETLATSSTRQEWTIQKRWQHWAQDTQRRQKKTQLKRWATRTQQKPWSEPRCLRRVSSFGFLQY
jgi:hypothetical protein